LTIRGRIGSIGISFMTTRTAARASALSTVAVRLSRRLSLLVLLLGILPGGLVI